MYAAKITLQERKIWMTLGLLYKVDRHSTDRHRASRFEHQDCATERGALCLLDGGAHRMLPRHVR